MAQARREPRPDLEAWEFALRAAVLAAGARLLEQLLQGLGCGAPPQPLRCACGAVLHSRGQAPKTLTTLLGPVTLRRSRFVCPRCHHSRFPADEMLAVEHTGFSPGVRRLMTHIGANQTFLSSSADLKLYAALAVSAKDVERVAESSGEQVSQWQQREEQAALAREPHPNSTAPIPVLYACYDGTGVPMTRRELAGRKGKQPDGSARTREAFLGCVFTQTSRDEKGRPLRDEASTTYLGAIINASEFGVRIHGEAKRRGLAQAQTVVVLADGAKKNWTIAKDHFPDATWIVDLYHARQHLHRLHQLLFPKAIAGLVGNLERWLKLLDEGQIEELLAAAQTRLPKHGKTRQAATKEINYFRNNKERMRYADFRARGLFVGSGVIEAGCKTIVGQRLKQTSMEWSVRGANAIIALRSAALSHRLEDFFEQKNSSAA